MLNLKDVDVMQTKRMSTWRNGKGLIKIQVGNQDQVKLVVQNKQLLSRSGDQELRSVYLRQSKRER